MIPLACLTGSFDIAVQYLAWHFSCDTGRTDNEVFMILFQISTIGTWTHIISVHPRVAHQLDEVLISIIILCQHDEVITTHIAFILLTVFLATMGYIHLTAYDGLERFQSLFLSAFVHLGAIVAKLLDAEHHTMVGNGHTLHAISNSLVHKTGNPGLTIKNGILGMNM